MSKPGDEVEDEIVRVVATAAAGVIFRAMGTSLWRTVRDRWVGLLGGGDPQTEAAMSRELDDAAIVPAEPDGGPRQELQAEWRGTIRALLREHPALLELVSAELDAESRVDDVSPSHTSVKQTSTVRRGVAIQSGRDTTIS